MNPDVTKELLEALRANHQRHIDNDDRDGYPGSDLEEKNLAAIARAEAEVAERQPDADGWVKWSPSEHPLEAGVHHQVMFRDGNVSFIVFHAPTLFLFYGQEGCNLGDIVARRVEFKDAEVVDVRGQQR